MLRRPRIIERIASACTRPIALIFAPAGYGKSVALEQYLTTLDAPHRRFEIASDAADAPELFAFVGAGENRSGWTIAIDALQAAQPDLVRRIVASIDATKSNVCWIIATRSSVGLPLATWLAYQDCDTPIDGSYLEFTPEEAGELGELAEFCGGWPVAIDIAMRGMQRGAERNDVRAAIRDVSRQYWLEQVYTKFDEHERDFLATAAALPEIDVGVLELAGYEAARRIAEDLRAQTGLLVDIGQGRYRCPASFLDFLRFQTSLQSAPKRKVIHVRAAQALESAGNLEASLGAYVMAGSHPDVQRLLELHAFDLLERGRSEAISHAVDALDDSTRRTNPRIIALRGVLQSLAGNPVRAEALLRRALSRANSDRDLVAFARVRLAPLIANFGGNMAEILAPVVNDELQPPTVRAEALSLLSVARAMAGERQAASDDVAAVESLLLDVDVDPARARILQRVGVAAIYIGENERAKQSLIQAAELASELGLHSVASRSWSSLSNLMCHAYDDVMSQLWYAEKAAHAAASSGDSLDLQTALLQVAAAEMRRGNAEESAAVEEQLVGIRSDPKRAQLLVAFKALRLAWDGRFTEAHGQLSASWNQMYHDFDKLICGAQCALFLALDDRRESSISLISEVERLGENLKLDGLFRMRYVALAQLLCSVAEVINKRTTAVNRIVRKLSAGADDVVVFLAGKTAAEFATRRGPWCRPEIRVALERFTALGYADVARVLEAACVAVDSKGANGLNSGLTPAEVGVLRSLSEGLSTKEIAARDGRSVNTIRAHVANALSKLKCRGRGQALAVARRLEIIP